MWFNSSSIAQCRVLFGRENGIASYHGSVHVRVLYSVHHAIVQCVISIVFRFHVKVHGDVYSAPLERSQQEVVLAASAPHATTTCDHCS